MPTKPKPAKRCPCKANTLYRAKLRRFDCCRSKGVAPADTVNTYKGWTPEEDAIVLSLPLAEAAEKLGRTVPCVKSRLHRLRLRKSEIS